MVLFSLENTQDVSLCGGGKRVCDQAHLRQHLIAESMKVGRQYEREAAYGFGTTRVGDSWR